MHWWTSIQLFDATRRSLFRVSFNDLEALIVLRGAEMEACQQEMRLAARIAAAADSLGIAKRALESTVSYLRERQQFGRPIASFQAIKHRCADISRYIWRADALLSQALQRLEEKDPEGWMTLDLAKASCCDAAVHAAAEAIQLHGGNGYTWEYDCHFLMIRAKFNEQFFGAPDQLRSDAFSALLDAHGRRHNYA